MLCSLPPHQYSFPSFYVSPEGHLFPVLEREMLISNEHLDAHFCRSPPKHGCFGNPLPYSCLENPTDRGDWWATCFAWGCKALDTTEHAWTRMHTHICTHGCFYLEWKHLAASCGHLCLLLPTAVYLVLAGVSWCCLESQECGLAAQVLSHRSLVTGKVSFHLLSENCQVLLRGSLGERWAKLIFL